MGNCCANDLTKKHDTNLAKMGRTDLSYAEKRALNKLPLHLVVKMQAMVRGFRARKAVKRIYGFQASPGLMNRGMVQIEMDPQKLEQQRQNVQMIRQQLPQFEYGMEQGEDADDGSRLEKRATQVLQDGAHYTGQWNVDTGERHGRGM